MAKSADKTMNEGRKDSTGELILAEQFVSIASPRAMQELADTLKTFVVENSLFTEIGEDDNAKKYVHVEGWQFAGASMGIFPQVVSEERIETEGEVEYQKKEWYKEGNKSKYRYVKATSPIYKYKATVELVNITSGKVVGRGVALCSNEEAKKRTFDEYAVLSMAQTRATGKAFRLSIGWIMKLAGYEATPTEEMEEDDRPSDDEDVAPSTAPSLPIEQVKLIVDMHLQRLTSGEKMKFLKAHANTIKSTSLSDEQYTRLFEEIARQREEAQADEVQPTK